MTPEELEALPSTQAEAHRRGSRFYYTGEPCVDDHLAARYEKTGACTECLRHRNKAYQAAKRGAAEPPPPPFIDLTRDWQPRIIQRRA